MLPTLGRYFISRQPSGLYELAIDQECLAVLWMLASFLCCHSNTETLNLTV